MPDRLSTPRGLIAGAMLRLGEWLHPCRLPIWYDPAYRLPLASVGIERGIEPRRADYVAWFLLERRRVDPTWFRQPEPVRYADLARVHERALLESLTNADGLARVFAVDPVEIPIDEAWRTIRLGCGATVAAAREAVATDRAAYNLLGGFHHAGPDHASGFCPVNDVAVAVAVLRAEGFSGRVVILDLDAHPPDGLAACFEGDDRVWIGSLSGADWGPLPGVDETVLPEGAGDRVYLAALDALLARMPSPDLAFVIAGGDVLAGDRLGRLGLSLAGARRRDMRVADAVHGHASVWLPGGGYHDDAWRVVAGTILAVGMNSLRPIPAAYDPLDTHFSDIAARLGREQLGGGETLDLADLEAELFGRGVSAGRVRLLGLWTAPGIELALFHYGILDHLARFGYHSFRVSIDAASTGQCVRLHARATRRAGTVAAVDDREYVLMECVLERAHMGGRELLFVNWLTLRHPLAHTGARRLLPGQEVPGLGLMREAGELLLMMARRLGLPGIAFCPAHYHLAFAARQQFRFLDPARQGRFEALLRDLGDRPLQDVSRAVSEGTILLDGEPYRWEATPMTYGIEPSDDEARRSRAAREQARFSMARA
ncbi:histone deacetylase [Haliangium sp.]|uniref:histone deacetylase n=1 Tax=Haliangium sp. TaxID=2663208 RepID=UPI003D0CD13D